MTYKFSRLEDGCFKRYEFDSIESARDWAQEQMDIFKKENKVVNEATDVSFKRYKSQFDNLRCSEG